MDFETATWSERARYEVAFIAIAATYATILLIAKEASLSDINNVPMAATVAMCLVHVLTLAARARRRQSFWLPVLTVFLDCFFSSLSHVDVQSAFWKELYRPFGVPRRPVVNEFDWMFGWHSLFHLFLLYVSLSYLTHFVLLARHAMVALVLGGAVFAGVLFAARSVLESLGQYRDGQREAMETLVIVVGMVIQVAAKFRAERSSRQIFEHLVESKEDVVRQKVLRCQAEFKFESLRQETLEKPSCTNSMSHITQLDPLREGPRAPSKRAARTSLNPSIHSAPADMLPSAPQVFPGHAAALQDGGCPGGAMDCFPASAAVWVSGETEPVLVGRLVPGQRVLCFDSLGGSVKYARVSEVKADSEAIEWVEVSLADGTALTVTSDHPMQPVGPNGRHLRNAPVPASSLTPATDSVMVHRVATLPVAVQSVSLREARGEMRERVSVSVHQPDRYSILVLAAGRGTDVTSMAMGSTNASGMMQHQDQVKNTFVHVCPDGLPARPRAASEPRGRRPRGRRDERRAEALDLASSSSSGRGPQPTGADPPRAGGALEADQERSSPRSEALICPDGKVELVCRPSLGAISDKLCEQSPQVAAAEHARSMGWPSLGCGGHNEGGCQPCQLHFRGKCLRGFQCSFCHLPHRQTKVRGRKILTPA